MDYHAFLADHPDIYFSRGSQQRRQVALSFDDGPGRATPDLLSLLRELEVVATFFCVGRAVRAESGLVARMLEEGHEVGNHSMSHVDARSLAPSALLEREVRPATRELLRAGVSPACAHLFRPAYGEIGPEQVRALGREGYTVAGWSIDPSDWLEPEAPGHADCVAGAVLARIHPGAIVLLHDGDDERGRSREGIVDIVRRLVPSLRGQGYEFVKVSAFSPAR